MSSQFQPKTPDNYISPLSANKPFAFVSAQTIFPYYQAPWLHNYYYQKVTFSHSSEPLFENTYRRGVSGSSGENIGFSTQLQQGTYTVYYEYGSSDIKITGEYNDKPAISATYTFQVVKNKFPLKRWTITDVINRLLDVAEPIRQHGRPRFRLNAEQAEKFDKILAPEFSFTKQTLRECLQQIGGFIHGEPRLKPVKDYVKVFISDEDFSDGRTYLGVNNPEPYEADKDYFSIINGKQYSVILGTEPDGSYPNYYLEIVGLPNYNGRTAVYTHSSEIGRAHV